MANLNKTKYIFVAGGVMSGIGKGVAVSSIAALLQSRGYKVSAIKIDPYINVDAGTMNPIEHGEVFVTEDGDETDQDIGNYERFLGINILRENYMTTGRVYLSVIERERNLGYGGRCVEVVPDIPKEVIRRIKKVGQKNDIVVIEIGGTVGEYQNILFLEAARLMKLSVPQNVLFLLTSYLPIPKSIGEMKTKPTQYATRTLNTAGINPDFIIARSEKDLDEPRKQKIATFCNVSKENIISAPDVENIYEVPLNFAREKLDDKILKKLHLRPGRKDLKKWRQLNKIIKNIKKEVTIGIVGKYFNTGKFTLADSYISVIESIKHACWHYKIKPNLVWLDAEKIEKRGPSLLKNLDGVIVPQGWGSRGAEGKIQAIKYARENKIPYLGLCYGMQMAVIEFARNVLKLKKANSLEVDPKTPEPVIYIMPNQKKYLAKKQFGGTIRLGAWPCRLKPNTKITNAYKKLNISERHRHRYEFNQKYRQAMEKKGLIISGISPDGKLVEAIEIKNHPFFVGVQFHPEYKSRPFAPHPLFMAFLKACIARQKA